MTYNAWCDHPAHPEWSGRRDACAGVFRRIGADLVGGQEFTARMLDDLAEDLPEYRSVGVGRDDGRRAGEFTPVFYRQDRMELLDSGTFWLAPDPATAGLGWNACCRRTATWATFLQSATNTRLFFLSTHFDHRGGLARIESAKLLASHVPSLAEGLPSVVVGDFNSRPSSRPHQVLSRVWRDARLASQAPPRGPVRTWRGWSRFGLGAARIDYIYTPPDATVVDYRVWDEAVMRRASDHRPVVARLRL